MVGKIDFHLKKIYSLMLHIIITSEGIFSTNRKLKTKNMNEQYLLIHIKRPCEDKSGIPLPPLFDYNIVLEIVGFP